jgi:CubicO group peptidase (beta-lactamase class C family)
VKLIKILFSFIFFLYYCSLNNCTIYKETKLNRLFRIYVGEVPGASLMIIKEGRPILIKTFGLAHVEEKKPVESSTNFRLASVTKQFTAMCIMQLEEQGKLTFSQTLTDVFPNFPKYGKEITIKNLLQHTSGLFDYESLIPDAATIQVLDKDVLNMMMGLKSTYFKPGSEYRYCNSNYAVLAMIVEKISGLTFAEYLKKNIFQPLGMNNTIAYEKGISTVNHRAYGYADENGKLIPKDQSLTSAVLGDGGIYSSVNDLFKWDQALYTEKLVKSETLNKAFTPGELNDGRKTNYGFGWRIDEYKGHYRVHHTGQTCGFANIIQRYPKDQFSIIILTNRNQPMPGDLADKIADMYLN